jgi:putative isomerase
MRRNSENAQVQLQAKVEMAGNAERMAPLLLRPTKFTQIAAMTTACNIPIRTPVEDTVYIPCFAYALRRSRRSIIFLILFLAAGVATASARSRSEISQLFEKYKVKEGIVKPPKGLLKYPYLVPSGPYFQLFDWDSYFMGVALSYDGDGESLANSVKDFLSFVGENANETGYVPREIAPDGLWALPEMCKPFLAQAAYRASLTIGSVEWLRPWYKKLAETLQFWKNTRRAPDGFFLWFNGVESGVDNNPAVTDKPAQVTEGVDLQCYIYREYRAMSLLAGKLGNSEDEAMYASKADALRAKIRDDMWSETEGTFLNIDARTGKQIHILTWTDFVPLWAGVATTAQAQKMIESHILNPQEFWARYGIRTLSPYEALYDPHHGYWRGPVWVISNYLIMHGLMNYGYTKQARELAGKTQELLVHDLQTTGGMNECYNPDDGTPLAGGHFVSWDLLGEHIVEEAEKGLDPTALNPIK